VADGKTLALAARRRFFSGIWVTSASVVSLK
jgi:hypothetical protein